MVSPIQGKEARRSGIYLGISNTSAILAVEEEISPMWIHEMAKSLGFKLFPRERTWLTHDLSRVHLLSSKLKGIATPLIGRDIPTEWEIIITVFSVHQREIKISEINQYLRKLSKLTFRDLILRVPDENNPTWINFFKTRPKRRKPLRVRIV
jgi:hypothetical protein